MYIIIINTSIFLPTVMYEVVGFKNRIGSEGTAFPSSFACSLQKMLLI